MKTKLTIPEGEVSAMLFGACHHIKSGPDLKKNIIVRFLNISDRDKCLEKAYNLKRGCGFGVSIDLPYQVAKQRERLLRIKNNLPAEEKKKAKLQYLKIHPFLILHRSGGKMEANIDYITQTNS